MDSLVVLSIFVISLSGFVFTYGFIRNKRVAKLSKVVSLEVECWLPDSYDIGEYTTRIRHLDPTQLSSILEGHVEPEFFSQDVAEIDFHALNQRSQNRKGLTTAGVSTGMLTGAGVLHKYLAIDDHVYDGIGRLTGEQFHSFTDLSAKVETYQHDIWDGLTDGALRKVGGHIGEVYAAEHFEKAGIEVEWPAASNQQGWDLLLNGHEVNVKLVENANQLYRHFAEYPDIPVIIPGDAVGIPDSALHFDPSLGIDQLMDALHSGQDHLIIVDHALSHADIINQAGDATDVLVGSADLADAATPGIPFITLAFSGWREAKLLLIP